MNSKQAFKDKRVLSELQTHYIKNSRLTHIVIDCLDNEFKNAISESMFFQNTLILIVSNQILASKLRYSLAQLIKQLKRYDEFRLLRKIKLHIKSSVDSAISRGNNLSKPMYSNNSAELLSDLSKLIDDPNLQDSLKKLAGHVRERKSKV